MKKALMIMAWLSGTLGALMMFIGSVAVFAGGMLWHHRWSNYFYPGAQFVILGIFLFLGVMMYKECKQE